jgi:phage I-like protein
MPTDTAIIHALNFEMITDGVPPCQLLLVPAGNRVTGRDGRSWSNPDPQAILNFFSASNLDIHIDIEHSTQLKAPKGEPAPAVAWGKSLEVRQDGSVWGNFDWNSSGADLVSNKQYRYYSPAYIIDRATNAIVGIKSVGLTNSPNLNVPALNREQNNIKEHSMEQLPALLAVLGLAASAPFDEALNSITKLKGDLTVALNSAASPPLDKFVPKADYDLALNRATSAEDKLTAQEKATLETAINSEIETALKAGKITPATQEYHVAQCHQEGGLERFRAFVAAAPTVAGDSNLATKKPGETDTALNAEQAQMAAMFGNSAADIEKYSK